MTSVVLLHAFPLDARMWKPQSGVLARKELRVITPDLRGFGTAYSQLGGLQEIPIDLAADEVAAMLDSLGIQKAVIGGISRGGYIAMAFAHRYPERLQGLMLFDTRATPADEKEKESWRATIERVEAEGMEPVPGLMKSRLFGPTALHKRQELVQHVGEIILSQKPGAVIAASRGMAARSDFRSILPAIRVPTLCIAGVEDGAFESTKAIAAAIPGATFIEAPEAGHLSNMERPDIVDEAILDFLATLEQPPRS